MAWDVVVQSEVGQSGTPLGDRRKRADPNRHSLLHMGYGHQIRCYCDNQAIVACLHSRTCKQKGIMHLLWCLLFVEAQRNCNLTPAYISTEANHLADDLSRDHLSSFFSKVPQANPHPTPVPPPLLDLLLDTTADWTSEPWSFQFSTTSRRV